MNKLEKGKIVIFYRSHDFDKFEVETVLDPSEVEEFLESKSIAKWFGGQILVLEVVDVIDREEQDSAEAQQEAYSKILEDLGKVVEYRPLNSREEAYKIEVCRFLNGERDEPPTRILI